MKINLIIFFALSFSVGIFSTDYLLVTDEAGSKIDLSSRVILSWKNKGLKVETTVLELPKKLRCQIKIYCSNNHDESVNEVSKDSSLFSSYLDQRLTKDQLDQIGSILFKMKPENRDMEWTVKNRSKPYGIVKLKINKIFLDEKRITEDELLRKYYKSLWRQCGSSLKGVSSKNGYLFLIAEQSENNILVLKTEK